MFVQRGSLKYDKPSVSVLVPTGNHLGYSSDVPASTTITRLLVPVMVNPNQFVRTPKLTASVCTCGFHSTVGRPPKVEAQPQPVVPGK